MLNSVMNSILPRHFPVDDLRNIIMCPISVKFLREFGPFNYCDDHFLFSRIAQPSQRHIFLGISSDQEYEKIASRKRFR
ncbi:Hypothetical predicted protein [Octopus vulgaris]|uniref:Uncharacterized protein n=1 Tax=Octopus vulgaris TaxID=6645 RepID=A0AA36FBP1_OCTVU|nr:Hypothetical predicted protein [Octopus vulgaris]